MTDIEKKKSDALNAVRVLDAKVVIARRDLHQVEGDYREALGYLKGLNAFLDSSPTPSHESSKS